MSSSSYAKSELSALALKPLHSPESGQSLFSLLLEIESRLRKEFRNDLVERRLKPRNNLSRYYE